MLSLTTFATVNLIPVESGIEFFTATCLNWQNLLQSDDRKQIIMDSLKFLIEDKRIWLYGFVIMPACPVGRPNHIHLMWRKQDAWVAKNVQQMFLKYTAQQIKFRIVDNGPSELVSYVSTQQDRAYQFWERRPYKATMYNRKVAWQKIDYIHYNPVKAGLCANPEDYKYSSAKYYELNVDDWGFLTHYEEHL